MRTVLLSINSKYIHTMPAARYLKAACPEFDVRVVEWNVNLPLEGLFAELFAQQPDVLGISCYIFNIGYVERVLRSVRALLPAIKIVLGGPEVSADHGPYESYADWIVCGEGEAAFRRILSEFPREKVIYGRPQPALDALNPPYSQEYLKLGKDKILYYESSRGCPFSCSYCMSGTGEGVRCFSMDRVRADLETLMRSDPMQIKFVDRTFNADRRRACEILRFLLENYRERRTNFHFEMAPELFSEELFNLFESAPKGLFQVEIGVQSFCERALEACDRNACLSAVEANVRRMSAIANVHVHTDLIAGLPYEDLPTFAAGFDRLFACRPDVIQLGFLKLLKGSRIREQMDRYGYRCYDTAPYEILCNDFLSFEDVCTLKLTEAALDRYYNSGRFKRSLAFIAEQVASPFDFFRGFGRFLQGEGAFAGGCSAVRQCDLLFAYASELLAETDPLARQIDLDFTESGNVRRWRRSL